MRVVFLGFGRYVSVKEKLEGIRLWQKLAPNCYLSSKDDKRVFEYIVGASKLCEKLYEYSKENSSSMYLELTSHDFEESLESAVERVISWLNAH